MLMCTINGIVKFWTQRMVDLLCREKPAFRWFFSLALPFMDNTVKSKHFSPHLMPAALGTSTHDLGRLSFRTIQPCISSTTPLPPWWTSYPASVKAKERFRKHRRRCCSLYLVAPHFCLISFANICLIRSLYRAYRLHISARLSM